MKKLIYAFAVMAIAAFVFSATSSEAVHRGAGDLTCGACHTMHNSQGNIKIAPSAANGPLILLRGSVTTRADVHNLCLACHSEAGTQASNPQQPHGLTAPKVYRTSFAWSDAENFTSIGAGGDFQWTLDTTGALLADDQTAAFGKGHSLGLTAPVPPGGSALTGGFSCSTCHDSHGAAAADVSTTATNAAGTINVFRNLRVTVGAGSGVVLTKVAGYAGGSSEWKNAGAATFAGVNSTLDTHTWPVSSAADSTSPCTQTTCNTYAQDFADANSGISGWCSQCHTDWHEDNTANAGNADGDDWRRHPVNNEIVDTTVSSGANVVITDYTHYKSTNLIAVNKRLPAAQKLGTAGANAPYYGDAASGADVGVFCLSCHFAHGGPYFDNLRWEHVVSVGTGGNTFIATAVPSNKGCQQCHNR